jgi:hypothetical protein
VGEDAVAAVALHEGRRRAQEDHFRVFKHHRRRRTAAEQPASPADEGDLSTVLSSLCKQVRALVLQPAGRVGVLPRGEDSE